ncbi:MAG: hypothetical protein IJZ29_05845 [Clostridia bacterium]|nr:hypothetical protein [Clostridia bacterium]
MYYCRDCKKVVKSGSVCSCGKELTRKDEIIYCPSCNKMYFKPSKSFTCKKCNAYVEIEPSSHIQEQTTNVNNNSNADSLYASMFLNNSNANNGSNSNASNASYQGTTSNASSAERFPYKAFESQSNANVNANVNENVNESSNAGQPQESKPKSVNDDFDVSLFEDANESTSKGGKKKVANNSSASNSNEVAQTGSQGGKKKKRKFKDIFTAQSLAVGLLFVAVIVAIVYFVVLPLVIPSYKTNWDKYVNAQNEIYRTTGQQIELITADFDVQKETDTQVIAKVTLEQKTYNESTKKYDNEMQTLTVEFVKKNGEFIINKVS